MPKPLPHTRCNCLTRPHRQIKVSLFRFNLITGKIDYMLKPEPWVGIDGISTDHQGQAHCVDGTQVFHYSTVNGVRDSLDTWDFSRRNRHSLQMQHLRGSASILVFDREDWSVVLQHDNFYEGHLPGDDFPFRIDPHGQCVITTESRAFFLGFGLPWSIYRGPDPEAVDFFFAVTSPFHLGPYNLAGPLGTGNPYNGIYRLAPDGTITHSVYSEFFGWGATELKESEDGQTYAAVAFANHPDIPFSGWAIVVSQKDDLQDFTCDGSINIHPGAPGHLLAYHSGVVYLQRNGELLAAVPNDSILWNAGPFTIGPDDGLAVSQRIDNQQCVCDGELLAVYGQFSGEWGVHVFRCEDGERIWSRTDWPDGGRKNQEVHCLRIYDGDVIAVSSSRRVTRMARGTGETVYDYPGLNSISPGLPGTLAVAHVSVSGDDLWISGYESGVAI